MREVSEEQLRAWVKLIKDNTKPCYERLGYLEREFERLLEELNKKSC